MGCNEPCWTVGCTTFFEGFSLRVGDAPSTASRFLCSSVWGASLTTLGLSGEAVLELPSEGSADGKAWDGVFKNSKSFFKRDGLVQVADSLEVVRRSVSVIAVLNVDVAAATCTDGISDAVAVTSAMSHQSAALEAASSPLDVEPYINLDLISQDT